MRWYVPLILSLAVSLAAALPASAQTFEAVISPFEDAEARALAVLDTAQRTVDVAHYNVRNDRFLERLAALRARGVRVRVVVDAKNAAQPWNTLDDRFEREGFEVRRYENTRSAWAIMHHKFTIVDDRVVLTGSYNWNETAQVFNDENMLVIEDPALVAAYRAEYEELLGAPERPAVLRLADAGLRDAYARAFRKAWGTAPPPLEPGAPEPAAEVYFSPEDNVRYRVLDLLRSARSQVLIAMFTFSDRKVAEAVRDAAARGVEVVLLVERKQADATQADEVAGSSGARVIVGANTSATHSAMHHKFAVIDGATVVTGACNWTANAFDASNEDLLVIRDPALARRYTDAFAALVRRYAPEGFEAGAFGVARAAAATHFVVTCASTQPGDALVVVGGHPALGAWDPRRGVPLVTSDSLFPRWGGRVSLPAGTATEWKLVVLSPDGAVRWELEGRGNRLLSTDPAGTDGVVEATFDGTRPPAAAPTDGITGGLPD